MTLDTEWPKDSHKRNFKTEPGTIHFLPEAEHIVTLGPDEKIIDMCVHNKKIIVATTAGVYEIDGKNVRPIISTAPLKPLPENVYTERFAAIKSIVSAAICDGIVYGQTKGVIPPAILNNKANGYADRIMEDL